MAQKESPYKRVKLEEATTDPKLIRSLSELDQPWKVRLETASRLAFGILHLFSFIVVCSGIVSSTLSIAYIVPGISATDAAEGIGQTLDFVKAILPYVATPLGVALGYFFRQTQDE